MILFKSKAIKQLQSELAIQKGFILVLLHMFDSNETLKEQFNQALADVGLEQHKLP